MSIPQSPRSSSSNKTGPDLASAGASRRELSLRLMYRLHCQVDGSDVTFEGFREVFCGNRRFELSMSVIEEFLEELQEG
jgi:hypothetical protein